MGELCYNCGQTMPKHVTKICDECGAKWNDGIDGCPTCGDGNPFKGIHCLTPMVMGVAKRQSQNPAGLTDGRTKQ